MHQITIAIDGFSSCGKSTLAKQLANSLGYVFVDSGAMYRAVTLFLLRENYVDSSGKIELKKLLDRIVISFRYNKEKDSSELFLGKENVEKEIREMQVSENVSRISAIPEVRKKLVALQQEMGKNKGVVMDGRDIGTVVFPDAELKIFMTADPLVRAHRRFDELKAKGVEVSLEEIKKNLEQRDYEDTHRAESPLTQAPDAVLLDNSLMSREEQFLFVSELAKKRIAGN